MRSRAATPIGGGPISDLDRSEFWAQVDNQNSIRPCWEWRGLSSEGRPRANFQGRRVLAHRAAYLLAYGIDPGEMHVLHSCDNDLCVNPRHLRLGTVRENAQDRAVAVSLLRMFAAMRDAGIESGAARHERKRRIAAAKLITSSCAAGFISVARPERPDRARRSNAGEGNSRATITDELATQIREAFWQGVERPTEIAARLGIDYNHVANVARRRCFSHLPLVAGEPSFYGISSAVKARNILARRARKGIRLSKKQEAPKPISRRTGRASLPVIRDGEVARDADGNIVTLGQLGRTRRKSQDIGAAA